ncbi:hypothetical protein CBM2608_A50029 [Cupriavidus taiwanensis]|nr:hypothetical protein CBM2608_A50029 [Cupriavidus taiwanensis]
MILAKHQRCEFEKCRLVPSKNAAPYIAPLTTKSLLRIVGPNGLLDAEPDANIWNVVSLRNRNCIRDEVPQGIKGNIRRPDVRDQHVASPLSRLTVSPT